MATEILIVPDIYYRNWRNEGEPGPPTGEMWLCLRPMVNGFIEEGKPQGIADFRAWAALSDRSLDGPAARFRYVEPAREQQCVASARYLPVNLPDDVRVQVTLGGLEEPPIKIPRPSGCLVAPAPKGSSSPFLPAGAGPRRPFPTVFNEVIRRQIEDPNNDPISAIHAVTQMLDFGRRVAWSGQDVSNPWPDIPIPELEPAPAGHVTGLYWLLGLMIPIGTQAAIDRIRKITYLDIELFAGSTRVGGIMIPKIEAGGANITTYFSRIGTGFTRKLTGQIAGDSCDPNNMPTDGRPCGRDKIVYVQPGLRPLRWDELARSDASIWRIEAPGGVPNEAGEVARPLRGAGHGEERSTAAGFPLQWLAAVEARAGLKEDADGGAVGTKAAIAFTPGLLVDGALSVYRRYPDKRAADGDKRWRLTLLRFDPDPGAADALDALSTLLDASEFEALIDHSLQAVGESGWTLKLVHAGRLPWDGPRAVYKLAATPPAGNAPDGESRLYPGRRLSLFIPVHRSPDGPAGAVNPVILKPQIEGANPLRFMWNEPDAKSCAQLRQSWVGRTPWVTARASALVNAFRVAGIADPKECAVTAMIANEFTFAAAESAVRLEKVLKIEGSDDCSALEIDDPRPDFEDDLINFNSAKLIGRDGQVIDERRLRIPQRNSADQTLPNDLTLARDQYIPLVHGWPRDPSDTREKPTAIAWHEMRDMIATHYGFRSDLAPGPFRAPLEHTYGDRLDVVPQFALSTRLDWPVEVASRVEKGEDRASPFMVARYDFDDEKVSLEVDFSLLNPAYSASPTGDAGTMVENRGYAAAVAAWRALAEIAEVGAQVTLEVEVATFDLAGSLPANAAEAVAKRGFTGGVSEAVATRPGLRKVVLLPSDHRLRKAAAGLVEAIGTDAPNFEKTAFEVQLPAGQGQVGKLAHAAKILLSIKRAPHHRRPDVEILLPFSQQPGLFTTAPASFHSVWAELGFGPKAPGLPNATIGPVSADLTSAHQGWATTLSAASHSVFPVRLETDKGTSEASAIIASLDGSNWFPPTGPGPLGPGLGVNAILVPLGFAPTRPFKGLEHSTQTALQRLAAALTDAIDVAYEAWTSLSAQQWRARFAELAAVAEQRADGDWDGNLAEFTRLIAQRLVTPQPADDPLNAEQVRKIVRDVRGGVGDLKWARYAVRRLMLRNPALFLDAKSLMINALRFVPDSGAGSSPPSSTVTRARFNRRIQGEEGERTVDPRAPGPERVSAVLTLEDLLLTGLDGAVNWNERFGFLEILDDVRYDNAFSIVPPEESADLFRAETFEEVIDPPVPPVTRTPGWRAREVVVPLAADAAKRIVRLASRSIVSPPALVWAGEAPELHGAITDPTAPTRPWSLDALRERRPPGQGEGGLRMALNPFIRPGVEKYADTGSAFAFYQIEGDEETANLLEALANDGFYIRLSNAPDQLGPSETAGAASEATGEAFESVERHLHALLVSARGSPAAANAVAELALDQSAAARRTFVEGMRAIIQSGTAKAPGADYALIRPTVGAGLEPRAQAGNQAAAAVIEDVALFRAEAPEAQGAQGGYLLFSFRTEVWNPKRLEMLHGRNLRYDAWHGTGPEPQAEAVFAAEFWQSAPQASSPTRHALTKAYENQAGDWNTAAFFTHLGQEWRRSQTVEALLRRMLRRDGLSIRGLGTDGPILSGGAEARWFDQELSISVYHEQFDDDPDRGANPVGRLLLSSKSFRSASERAVFFDADYDHFSVDLHWYSSSGLSLLRLDRMFVKMA